MKIDVLTLFPEMFGPVVGGSILGRAAEKGLVDIRVTDIRDFTLDKHNRTDDYPFGGGGGMVMTADPIFRSLEHIGAGERHLIYMSPRGRILDMDRIKELSETEGFVILCGHYEGVDQRVLDYWDAEEISIGDYILTGGELPAMVLIDSVVRLLPEALGNENSAMDESVYSGLLEHPQYTKPREYRGMEVPEVLLSGNHGRIDLWKFYQSLMLTKERRPDMLEKFLGEERELSKEQKRIIEEIMK